MQNNLHAASERFPIILHGFTLSLSLPRVLCSAPSSANSMQQCSSGEKLRADASGTNY